MSSLMVRFSFFARRTAFLYWASGSEMETTLVVRMAIPPGMTQYDSTRRSAQGCSAPCAEEAACCAEDLQRIRAVAEVAGVDLGVADVFNGVEGGEFGGDLGGSEEELEGLAGLLDS